MVQGLGLGFRVQPHHATVYIRRLEGSSYRMQRGMRRVSSLGLKTYFCAASTQPIGFRVEGLRLRADHANNKDPGSGQQAG